MTCVQNGWTMMMKDCSKPRNYLQDSQVTFVEELQIISILNQTIESDIKSEGVTRGPYSDL